MDFSGWPVHRLPLLQRLFRLETEELAMYKPDEHRAAEGVYRIPLSIVNAYLVGEPGASDRGWVLIDTGLSISAKAIRQAAASMFGPDSRPAAIILTHGHFDHTGSLEQLLTHWPVPVFAHRLEMPYLTGRADYPPPDPAAGGGTMSLLSPLFSRRGIDLGEQVHPLSESGALPYMPGWRWIHTPGHSPGHVSLFRDEDRTLIAGDAFVTTKQESFFESVFKPRGIHGPPAYFTTDWKEAGDSVRKLAQIKPAVAATGHGAPMSGERLHRELGRLASRFEQIAVPSHGRYAQRPARADENGVTYIPPPVFPPAYAAVAVGMGAVVGLATSPSR